MISDKTQYIGHTAYWIWQMDKSRRIHTAFRYVYQMTGAHIFQIMIK